MKKRNLLLIIIMFFLSIGVVNAASVSIVSSSSNVDVGSTFKVTVTINDVGQGAGKVGAWKYCLDYNSTNLTLTDPATPCVADGVVGLKQASATYTFKANNTADNVISLSGLVLYDYDTEQPISVDKKSVTVKAAIKEVTKNVTVENLSNNNNLKKLEVVGYNLTPAFNKDVTEYALEVDSNVDEVQVNAFREDTTASITPIDMVSLTEGINKVKVTLTAQNGNKKTYTITITRGKKVQVEVEIDGKKYNVVGKKEGIEIPNGFVENSISINDNDVPAYVNENAKIILVLLEDSEGKVDFYIYQDGKFIPFNKISSSSITVVPTNTSDLIEGYEKKRKVVINDKEVEVYYKEDGDNLVLVYGKNISTGSEGWYYYDITEGTMLKYIPINTNVKGVIINKGDTDYRLLAIVFASVSAISILVVILLFVMNSKLKNKNEEMFNYIEEKIRTRNEKRFAKIVDKEKNDNLVDLDKTIEKTKMNKKLEDTEEVEETEEIEDTVDNTIVSNTITQDIELEEVEEKKTKKGKKKKLEEITSEEDILNNIAKANEESFNDEEKKDKKISKKEARLNKKREKKLAKQARMEFLDDRTFEKSAFDEYNTENIPIVDENEVKKDKKK